jgi:hypothetical protein
MIEYEMNTEPLSQSSLKLNMTEYELNIKPVFQTSTTEITIDDIK